MSNIARLVCTRVLCMKHENVECPRVDANMEEAWNRVVRLMRRRGWTCSLCNKEKRHTVYFYWSRNVNRSNMSKRIRTATHKDPATAICLAALYASGVDKVAIREALSKDEEGRES